MGPRACSAAWVCIARRCGHREVWRQPPLAHQYVRDRRSVPCANQTRRRDSLPYCKGAFPRPAGGTGDARRTRIRLHPPRDSVGGHVTDPKASGRAERCRPATRMVGTSSGKPVAAALQRPSRRRCAHSRHGRRGSGGGSGGTSISVAPVAGGDGAGITGSGADSGSEVPEVLGGVLTKPTKPGSVGFVGRVPRPFRWRRRSR